MSIFSNFLKLFKYEPTTDGQNTFNIQTALNNNWDKVDTFATDISQQLEHKADITQIPTSLPANGGNADTLDGLDSTAFARDVHGHNWLNMQMGNEVSLVKDFNSANGFLFVNYRDALVPIVTYIMCDGTASDSLANMKAKNFYAGENLVWNEGNFPKVHSSGGTGYGVGTADAYGHLKILNNLTTNSVDAFALHANQGKILNDTKAPKHQSGTSAPTAFVGEGVLFGVYS